MSPDNTPHSLPNLPKLNGKQKAEQRNALNIIA